MANHKLQPLPTEERDRSLGRYMDTWSRMEGLLSFVTSEILNIDQAAGQTISAAIMTRQAIDLLEAAAKLRLNETGVTRTLEICKKLIRRNMRRNSIAHGRWIMHVSLKDDGPSAEWVRVRSHIDPEKTGLRPDDSGLMGNDNFTIPVLDKTTDCVEDMVLALSSLYEDIPSLRVSQQTPAE